LPDNFTLTATTSVTSDTVLDVTVDAVRLDILALSDDHMPINGVGVTFSSSGSQTGYGASSTGIVRSTGTNGRTFLIMLRGTTYTINAVPPTGLGFIPTTFNGTSPITQDSEALLDFQNHIPAAPQDLDGVSPTKDH